MKKNQIDISKLLEQLFHSARSKGELQYIYTLVRVEGLTSGVPDPLLELNSSLQTLDINLSDEELLSNYCSLAYIKEPLSLITNLLSCTRGESYNPFPFLHLRSGDFPNYVEPTPSNIAREAARISMEAENLEMATLVDEAYPDDVLAYCSSHKSPPDAALVKATLEKIHSFLTSLLKVYSEERISYLSEPTFHKLSQSEVLELIVNEKDGLYGFRMHFPNGNSATFARHPESTECTNIDPGVSIKYYAGDLSQSEDEWRIDTTLMYELRLPGRYNKLGEWKPIIYPGNTNVLERKARSLSEDPDVRGALFYIYCTGYWVIEFVLSTTIKLPRETVSFSDRFHLWKCLPLNGDSQSGNNIWIYDGWLELESIDPEYIKAAIASISIGVNRFAFAYGASVNWHLKYSTTHSGHTYATPSEDDLHILDSILRSFPKTEDASILDAAIDWYNRGRSSRNPFTAFLCHYIALESVAITVENGTADFGLKYSRGTKKERRQKREECIKLKHDESYANNPEEFIKQAYFDCVVGLKEKTRRIVELVFGQDHEYLETLFKKRDGFSLNDIRGKLAHGHVTLLDKEDESLVRKRLSEIAEISKDFLIRIIFFLQPTDSLPSWSQSHASHLQIADPRTTMVASNEKIFPTDDWRIRSEWCV